MGKFKDWFLGRKSEPEPEPYTPPQYAPAAQTESGLAVGPPVQTATAPVEDYDYDPYDNGDLDLDEGYDAGLAPDAPIQIPTETFPPGTPGWKRKGRPYVHFRTVKIVERDGGFKFKIRGRSGKPRFKSDLYTEKSNAKRAAVTWVNKSEIPTRFSEDQYGGAVVFDNDPQD